MEGASSDVNGSNNIHVQKKQRTEDKTRSAMLDFDVLDCPLCCEPLTIPIFQCDNGHLACSSCCPKLSNKCPACALPVGHNRCRAMESVVESVFVPCPNAKFGCTKKLSYGKESTHEKECNFSQCSCPVQDCNYSGSYKDLYGHCNRCSNHMLTCMCQLFCCGKSFHVRMNISDKMVILMEYMKSLVFAVQCFRESCGLYVTVRCIAPSAPEVGEFSYQLSYIVDKGIMIYKSEVKRALELSSQRPEESFMLIPQSLLRGELLVMKLCIKKMNKE